MKSSCDCSLIGPGLVICLDFVISSSLQHAPILLLTSAFSHWWLLLWECTDLQRMTHSPSSLIYWIWLHTDCNMPWFRELPLAKLSPLRSFTHRTPDSFSTLWFSLLKPCNAFLQKRTGDKILVSYEFREFSIRDHLFQMIIREHQRSFVSNAE